MIPPASSSSSTSEENANSLSSDLRLQFLRDCLLILVALIFILDRFALLIQQIFIAAFVTCLLLPIPALLIRRKWPRLLAHLVPLLILILIAGALGWMVRVSLTDLDGKLPLYRANLQTLLDKYSHFVPGSDADRVRSFVWNEPSSLEHQIQLIHEGIRQLLHFTTHLFIVLIYVLFMIAERASIGSRLSTAYGTEKGNHVLFILAQINTSVTAYIGVKAFVSLLTGILTALALWILGVDYPLLWGTFAFFMNFIPYLGSLIAICFPVLLSLVQYTSLTWSVVVFVVLLSIQIGVAYGTEPFLTGNRLNMSPLVIIVSLAIWASLWGIVGMVLAIPLMVVVRAVLEHIPSLKSAALLLANAPLQSESEPSAS